MSADPAPPRIRPQLDADTILSAALRLARDGGTEPLTVRRLGKELGADPTAIYRHFRDKDELIRAVIDRLIGDGAAGIDVEADWRTRLGTLADVTLEIFTAHPTIGAEAATRTTGGQGELAAVDLIIRAMVEAGLGPDDSVRYYAVFSSYLLAFCSAQARALLVAGPTAFDDDPRWVGGSSALSVSRLPAVAAVRDRLEALRDRDVYRVGVEVILDAVEAQARAAAS